MPASGLKAFAAQAVANPSAPLSAAGTFQVTPPGQRAFYCFSRLGQNRQAEGPPAGHDFCDGEQGSSALADRNSGHGNYVPVSFGRTTLLAVQTPVYRDGNVPSTVTSRQTNFVGWIGMSVEPDVILDIGLEGHPGTSVSLRYGEAPPTCVHRRQGRGRLTTRNDQPLLHNGRTVEPSSVSADGCSTSPGHSASW